MAPPPHCPEHRCGTKRFLSGHSGSCEGSTMARKKAEDLRSARWLGRDDFRSFNHRTRVMQLGYAQEDWAGKPVIAIVNTWSDINPCHGHFRDRVADVKRGVLQAGGLPLEFPGM